VKLTDEERAEFFKWRRERDVLRRPGEEVKPPEKGAKEFRDQVRDKAVEYLKAEIAKKGKRDAQAPAPNVERAAQGNPQPEPQAPPRLDRGGDGPVVSQYRAVTIRRLRPLAGRASF